jgi:PhnB protein
MRLNPYLNFNGQCEAAFKFYERCLGGKIQAMMPHAGTPMEEHTPPEWRDKILHASMVVGDNVLMGSDAPPDQYETPKGISVSIQIADPADAERVLCSSQFSRHSGLPSSVCLLINSAFLG